jgi:hypothetical protein
MDRLRYFLAPDHNYFLFRFKKFTSGAAVAGSLFAAYASTEEKTTFEIGSAAATSPRQGRRRTTPFAWTTPKNSQIGHTELYLRLRARVSSISGFSSIFRACAVITQRARIEYVGTCAVVS